MVCEKVLFLATNSLMNRSDKPFLYFTLKLLTLLLSTQELRNRLWRGNFLEVSTDDRTSSS